MFISESQVILLSKMSLHHYVLDLGTFLLTHACHYYVNSTTLITVLF